MVIMANLLRVITILPEIINPRVMAFVVIIGIIIMLWLGVSYKGRIDPLLNDNITLQEVTENSALTRQDEIINNLKEQVRQGSK